MSIRTDCLSAVTLALLLTACVMEADADESPAEVLEREREAVLAAKTLDEVIEYMPPPYQEEAREWPDERKQGALHEWKAHVKPLIYQEMVEGDRAAVLVENPVRDRVEIKVMKHDGESWSVVREIGHVGAVAGARGSFTLKGSTDTDVPSALVMQTHINTIPVLSLSDELRNALSEEREVPSMTIPLERCLTVGIHDLSPKSSGNLTLGPSFSKPAGDGEKVVYKHEPAGELEVTDVRGDRFDGRFRFTVKGEEPGGVFRSAEERDAAREVVTIVGSFEGAKISCDENGPAVEVPALEVPEVEVPGTSLTVEMPAVRRHGRAPTLTVAGSPARLRTRG